jgi:rare lipoprotein A
MTRNAWIGANRFNSPSLTVMLPRFQSRAVFVLCCLFVLGIFSLSGCASRKTVARRRPPVSQRQSSEPQPLPDAAETNDSTHSAPSTEYFQEGNASWYGVPFHGRRASNGDIYDMHKLTAAHRTLPFNTMVRVTNLNNGRSTTVRINDRGPFVENRILDLSFAAARELDSVGPGVVPVRLEILTPGIDLSSGYFTVQVGAFRDPNNAERLGDRLRFSYSPVLIQRFDSADGLYYRVRVGKVSGEDAARRFGEQLRIREGFTPFVVRLDDSAPAGEN